MATRGITTAAPDAKLHSSCLVVPFAAGERDRWAAPQVAVIMHKDFQVGARVRVSAEDGWRQDFTGRVVSGPESINTRQGEDYWYIVRFDTPQDDLSDDGPYFMAQILSRYIEAE